MQNRLGQLREAILAIEQGAVAGPCSRLASPVAGEDGLPMPPGVHEWFGPDLPGTRWVPPLGILLYLALRSIDGSDDLGGGRRAGVVWIGRRCWPFLQGLSPDDRGVLFRRSVFIDPPDDMSRLWAIDLAARCPAAAAVVADGSRLDMAATRRLQLAAESGSAPVLCARPPGEIDRLSAAATRWRVRCASSADKIPRWNVELLRCKGMRPGGQWTVEWRSARAPQTQAQTQAQTKAGGSLVVHAVLADRPDPATPARSAPARRSA